LNSLDDLKSDRSDSSTGLIKADITALVLAGGKASRFNGQDKGLIEFQGKPMISHVIDALKPQVNTLLISANRNTEQYQQYGYPVVADTINSIEYLQGPLAGILQGLKRATTHWVLLSPCDTPFIATDYCQRMISAVKPEVEKLIVATCENKLQPLFSLIPTSFVNQLAEAIDNERYKVGHWVTSMPHTKLEFPDIKMFININSTKELTQAAENFLSK